MVITGEKITLYRMATLKVGLKLECKGLKKRGESCFSIIKREWNLKGTKQKVLEEFSAIYEKAKIAQGIQG
ncbi:MAG: hypothetical protein EKK64_06510 [Neisseriaceae bacterium]|nr:MAG: hypothetical protein EKK64_06510 [Neisseriaceae bacterium]